MGWRVFERAGRFADGLLGLLGNRLSLFGLELQEELERLLICLASLLMAAVFTGLAFVCASVALLVFAAQHGFLLQASIILAALYALLAGVFAYRLWQRVLAAPEPFAATRAEFERDRECLVGRQESGA